VGASNNKGKKFLVGMVTDYNNLATSNMPATA
jgi:hypothetical protein